jgi:hypothetical protein
MIYTYPIAYISYYFLEKNGRRGLVGKKLVVIPVGFNVSKILI